MFRPRRCGVRAWPGRAWLGRACPGRTGYASIARLVAALLVALIVLSPVVRELSAQATGRSRAEQSSSQRARDRRAAPRAGTRSGKLAVDTAVDTVIVPAVVRSAATHDTASLVVHNRVVVVFRAPLGVLSPDERAAAALRRVNAVADTLAAMPRLAPGLTEAARVGLHQTVGGGVVVAAGGRGLFTITPADIDTAGGQTLASVATTTAHQMGEVLEAEREERSLPHLLRAAALALAATVLFFVGLRLVRTARRALLHRLPEVADPQQRGLRVGGVSLLSADQLLGVVRRLVRLQAWAVGLFGAYIWLAFVLTRFAYSRPWGEALGSYLTNTISRLTLTALHAVPGLFTVFLILTAARWLTTLVSGFFDAVQAGRVEQAWFHPETASATKRIVVALLWLLALVVAYPYMPGSGSDVFKGISVFAGVVLSLGSSGIVSQGMSGLVLMYARALKPGDYVRVGETEGTVTALGLLSTKIRTTKREQVTVPNAVMIGAGIKNYSRLATEGDGVIVYTSVTIGYDVPWRQVEAMLLIAAQRTEGLLDSPRPFVLKTGLSDFYVEYQLNAHLAAADRRIPVLSALHGHVVDVFNEHEVQILSPHYMAEPQTPAVVPRSRWFASPARATATDGSRGDTHGRANGQPIAGTSIAAEA